jgi:hypothetical protein
MKYLILFLACTLLLIQFNFITEELRLIRDTPSIKSVPYNPPKYRVLSESSSTQEIKEAVIEEFGEKMALIVNCESGFNVRAYNPKDPHGGSYGIFQINGAWTKESEKMGIDIKSVRGNFEIAKVVLKTQGYKAWSCSRNI